LLEPERQVLAWLQPARPDHFTPDRFPVFNLLVPEGRYYGFPIYAVPGFKFGRYHHLEELVDPEQLDREPGLRDEQVLREFAERYFPDGAGPTMSLKSCLFTNTPDHHFIIDLHPSYPQVSFTSPCSGHGFKFASVIGEIMADLAERGETRHNIELFRLARFAGHPRAHGSLRRQRSVDQSRFSRSAQARFKGGFQLANGDWLPERGSLSAAEADDAIRPFW
jgi:sarcosine oxidase